MKRWMIERAMVRHGGSRTRVASELDISVRALCDNLKRYGHPSRWTPTESPLPTKTTEELLRQLTDQLRACVTVIRRDHGCDCRRLDDGTIHTCLTCVSSLLVGEADARCNDVDVPYAADAASLPE